MGNSNTPAAHSISSIKHRTFNRPKHDVEHSQSTTAVQFQKDLLKHQKAEEEFVYLAKLTTFDAHTLRLLKSRFDMIDQTIKHDGQISIEEFAQVLQMDCKSILLRRFFKFMDKSSMGSLNFRNFATALSLLSPNAPDEDKMKLSFFLYDINDDRCIDREECTKMVELALDEINMKLSEQQIQVIVNNTFREADLNGDDRIDYDEYKVYCQKNPRVLQPFKVDITSLVLDEQENRRGRRMSGAKSLRHWQTISDHRNNNTVMRKIKKAVPSYMKPKKVEKVRSIRKAKDIKCLDDSVHAQYWDDGTGGSGSGGGGRKRRSGAHQQHHSEQLSSQRIAAMNLQQQQHKLSIEDEDEDEVVKLPLPGQPSPLKIALSADHAERRKQKTEKYSMAKLTQSRSKHKKQKKKPKMAKKASSVDVVEHGTHIKEDEDDEDDDDVKSTEKRKESGDVVEHPFAGMNTTVPRTPPKSNETPADIKQADLDALQKLLSD